LAYLLATRSDCDASVGYYGVGIENALAERSSISKPLMLHIAEADAYVPPTARDAIMKALQGNDLVTVYSYPDCDHAFARVGGIHYDKGASDLASRRSADFLSKHLR
jgi:carboxymethylenebutenolidase